MLQRLKENLKESFKIIIPIVVLVIMLSFILDIPSSLMLSFILSSVMLILGTGLFTFGADLSMMIIGERLGNGLVKSKKTWLILLVSFIIGTIVTIAEPDLKVLADQVLSIPNYVMILTISIGVGISLLLSSLRSIKGWDLNTLLFIGYSIVFILLLFVPEDFVPLAFDSGGITTGTISIPFILTLGIGLTATRIDKKAKEDSFGLVALCSIGPIITVLLLGLFYDFSGVYETSDLIQTSLTLTEYLKELSVNVYEVLISILPIVAVFIIYQLITKDLQKREIRKIIFGLLVTIHGLTFFFTALNMGFMDMGYYLGKELYLSPYKYLMIPFAMVVAYFIAIAEPAVQMLNEQVEEVTGGSISKKSMNIALAIGVALATGLSIIRLVTETSFLYYIIPGQILSLILMLFTPKIFTAIAFDAGGATGGSLTAAFLLPLLIGICLATGADVLTGAFGLAALISLAPLITIQIVGIMYEAKSKAVIASKDLDDTIIDFNWEKAYE